MPSEPTRHQLSSRLAFNQKTPTFIQRLKNQVAGLPSNHRDDDDENPSVDFEDEFTTWQENGGSGRPPIPTRPRDDADAGDGKDEYYTDEFGRERRREHRTDQLDGEGEEQDDEEGEEKPLVVVLKEGKHLSAWEAENEKRKAKGLPPLPDPSKTRLAPTSDPTSKSTTSKSTSIATQTLSFSSTHSSLSAQKGRLKRKILGDADRDDEDEVEGREEDVKRLGRGRGEEKARKGEGKNASKDAGNVQGTKKKVKKEKKTLLSFGDEG